MIWLRRAIRPHGLRCLWFCPPWHKADLRLEPGHCFGCGSARHLWADCASNPVAARG